MRLTNDDEYDAWMDFLENKFPYESLIEVFANDGYGRLTFDGERYVNENGDEMYKDDYPEFIPNLMSQEADSVLQEEFWKSEELEQAYEREEFDIKAGE